MRKMNDIPQIPLANGKQIPERVPNKLSNDF